MRVIRPIRQNKIWKKNRKNKFSSSVEFDAIPGWTKITGKEYGFFYRFIWLSIVSCSFLLCLTQISERVALFLSNPIATEIIVQKNVSVKYPSFIVCAHYHNLVKLWPLKKLLSSAFCDVQFEDVMARFNYSMLKMWHFVEVDSLIKDPVFHQWNIEGKQLASPLNVSDTVTPYGNCKKIIFKNAVPYRKGSSHLKIEAKDNYIICNNAKPAFYVMRADYDEIKYNSFFDNIEMYHYKQLIYGVTARQFEYLNTLDDPCTTADDYNRCRDKCMEKYVYRNMSCKLPGLTDANLPICTTHESYVAMIQTLTLNSVIIDYRLDCNCPKPCKETVYTLILKHNRNSLVPIFDLYFDDNEIDLMRQYYSYTIIPFLCDVGGNLGLFLGLCIPTVLEIVESFFVSVKRRILKISCSKCHDIDPRKMCKCKCNCNCCNLNYKLK